MINARARRLPTFEEIRRDAHKELGDVEDLLRSDWVPGTGPSPKQAELLSHVRSAIRSARAALDEVARS